jgi:hypothetical protein
MRDGVSRHKHSAEIDRVKLGFLHAEDRSGSHAKPIIVVEEFFALSSPKFATLGPFWLRTAHDYS